VTMVDDTERRVRAEVDERDLHLICEGQTATISTEAYPSIERIATISRIYPSMGRRTVLSGDPAEKSDRDIQEVSLVIEGDLLQWPIGLRVVARLHACQPPGVATAN
jgi:HlyD family secretion protein